MSTFINSLGSDLNQFVLRRFLILPCNLEVFIYLSPTSLGIAQTVLGDPGLMSNAYYWKMDEEKRFQMEITR